jgi:hypothetical protein
MTFSPRTGSGPEEKAIKVTGAIERIQRSHTKTLSAKKTKTAAVILRFTLRFQAKLDSPQVNLAVPKVKSHGWGEHS